MGSTGMALATLCMAAVCFGSALWIAVATLVAGQVLIGAAWALGSIMIWLGMHWVDRKYLTGANAKNE